MSQRTSIEWTDATWNPTRGCSRVSEGCRNCYAERQAYRFSGASGRARTAPTPFEGFVQIANGHPQWTGKVTLVEERLADPLRWKRPRRIFVNSMSDLFHEGLPDEAIDRVFAVMALCPQHTFQVLTKRPARMLEWATKLFSLGHRNLRHQQSERLGWSQSLERFSTGKIPSFTRWTLPNVWFGVSVEHQKAADERIPLLIETPAAVRFVSYEPALGPVDFSLWLPIVMIGGVEMETWLDQIIVGGESGPGARPFNIDWARNTIAQCREANVACFVKQLGASPYGFFSDSTSRVWPYSPELGEMIDQRDSQHDSYRTRIFTRLKDRKGGNWNEWPDDLRVRQFPFNVAPPAQAPSRSRPQ